MHIHIFLPSFILIEIYDKDILNIHKSSCTRMHIKILFIIARNYGKNPKYSSKGTIRINHSTFMQ